MVFSEEKMGFFQKVIRGIEGKHREGAIKELQQRKQIQEQVRAARMEARGVEQVRAAKKIEQIRAERKISAAKQGGFLGQLGSGLAKFSQQELRRPRTPKVKRIIKKRKGKKTTTTIYNEPKKPRGPLDIGFDLKL